MNIPTMSCAYNDSLECLHLFLKKYADISIVEISAFNHGS